MWVILPTATIVSLACCARQTNISHCAATNQTATRQAVITCCGRAVSSLLWLKGEQVVGRGNSNVPSASRGYNRYLVARCSFCAMLGVALYSRLFKASA